MCAADDGMSVKHSRVIRLFESTGVGRSSSLKHNPLSPTPPVHHPHPEPQFPKVQFQLFIRIGSEGRVSPLSNLFLTPASCRCSNGAPPARRWLMVVVVVVDMLVMVVARLWWGGLPARLVAPPPVTSVWLQRGSFIIQDPLRERGASLSKPSHSVFVPCFTLFVALLPKAYQSLLFSPRGRRSRPDGATRSITPGLSRQNHPVS